MTIVLLDFCDKCGGEWGECNCGEMTMLELLLQAAHEYYSAPGQQPNINIRWDKEKTVFVIKMYLDAGEDEHSCVTQAEGKTPDEAIMRLAEAWAKMKFECNAINRFLETLRGKNK